MVFCEAKEKRRCRDKPDKLAVGVGQAVATCFDTARKVRAPQGKVPGNAWAARVDGKCNRKQTAERCRRFRFCRGAADMRGKGETVW